MAAASTPEALQKLAEANMANATSWFRAQIDELSEATADASSTFAMASPEVLIHNCDTYLENLEQYLQDLVKRLCSDLPPGEPDRLNTLLAPANAYITGWMHGGGVPLAILKAFPEGDWDDPSEVKRILRAELVFAHTKLNAAVQAWANTYQPPTDRPTTPAPAPRRAARPAPTSVHATRIEALLAFAGSMGVRIKKVPSKPSDSWLDKLEAKLKQVATKKKVEFLIPPWRDELPEHDDQTSAEPPPASPEALKARHERIEAMLKKAEKAELKLGRIPDEPTDAWLDETEAKLKGALDRRRAKRKAERERKSKQRKARIERLQKNASSVGVELGRIPPFPTEDWIARSEMRIATEMLKEHTEVHQDKGRAERLTTLLANAAPLGVDLDVPPDPDNEWFEWAEGQIKEAERSDELLTAGEAENEHDTPVLYYEEGTVQEQAWPLDGSTLSIGRTRKNDVPLPHDAQISRNHCILRLDGETWAVEDLKSTRGTLVNGNKIKGVTPLTDGDTLQCGDTELVFRAYA